VKLEPLFQQLLEQLIAACLLHYGERLVALAVFGSVGRGTPRPDSDVDVLIVADGLPNGRVRRVDEFRAVERALAPQLAELAAAGCHTELSPVFKTRAEIEQGSPLLLDLVDDARILYDRDHFLRDALACLRARLAQLGARRIWRGEAWWWDLKPDYRVGEVFQV
jgi:predicted nucleotidyltransferase